MSARRTLTTKPNTREKSNASSEKASAPNLADQRTTFSRLLLILKSLTVPQRKIILRGSFFLFIFLFWYVRYSNFLFMAQEYDFFSWRVEELVDASSRVAGLSRLLSSFFIQFFYYPIVGAFLLAGFALLTQRLTEKIFDFKNWKFVLSFIPPCLSTLLIASIGYYLFERVDVAYLFSFTFNFCYSLLFVFLFDKIKVPQKRIVFFIAFYFISYPIFGFFTLLSGLVCIFMELLRSFQNKNMENACSQPNDSDFSPKKGKRSQNVRERCELLFLFILATPCLYWFVFSKTTPNFYDMYLAGLWEESTLTQGREPIAANFFTPFLLLAQGKSLSCEMTANSLLYFYLSLEILFFLLVPLYNFLNTRRLQSKRKNVSITQSLSFSSFLFSCAALAIVCIGVTFLSFSTPNFQALLQVARSLDQENWERLLKQEAKVKDPINPLISARILALVKTNRLADEAFQRPLNPKDSQGLRTISTFSMCGDRILYEYGDFNHAERTAINDLVTKRDRSVWALKTLILCGTAKGQPNITQRYLYRLQGTLFHKKFAQETADYLSSRNSSKALYTNYMSSVSKTSDKRLKELDDNFAKIRKLQSHNDCLASFGPLDRVRLRIVQNEDLIDRSVQDSENILTTLLIARDFSRFTELLDQYLSLKGKQPLPRHLQEAVLFCQKYPKLFIDRHTEKSWTPPQNVHIDPQVRQRFQGFASVLNTRGSDEVLNAKLRPQYGDTFWFFYGAETNMISY